MSFVKDYKASKAASAGFEPVPVIKMGEIEGKKFTVREVKLRYDMETDYGTFDTAILTVIVEGEKRTLFIRQPWLFEMFESAVNDGYQFTESDTFVLRKKTKGDKTFWDITEN